MSTPDTQDPDRWLNAWVADSLAYLIGECGTPPWRDAHPEESSSNTA